MLTERQLKFCRHYLATSNGAEAVRVAGYKCKDPGSYGSRLLKTGSVKAFLTEQLDSLTEDRVARASEILEFYTNLMRGSIDSKDEVKISERLKAAEALGKILSISGDRSGGDAGLQVKIVDDVV